MIRLKNQTKFIIIIVVIALSLYLGMKRSNIMDAFSNKVESIDIREAQKIFDNAHNQKKYILDFKVDSFENIDNAIYNIEGDINVKYSNSKLNYKTYVLEIPDSNYAMVIKKLKTADTVTNENLRTAPEEKFTTNIKANVQNQVIAKKRIQELINKSTSPERMQLFRIQLERIQTKIDSLENQISKKTHNQENSLILLTAISNVKKEGISGSLKVFIQTTIILLIVFTIILFIFFYFMVLIFKLMALAGIKTARGSASNYNYNYNKKTYGRRIKRVYKDNDGKTIDEKVDDD